MNQKVRRNVLFVILIAIILLILLLKGCTNTKKQEGELIVFEDPTFEKMIKKALNKEDVYSSDLDEYTGVLIAADRLMSLSGPKKTEESIILFGFTAFEYKGKRYEEIGTIESLKDLSHFKNLSNLKVYLQPKVDFNTIPTKQQIYILSLSQNKIEDLSFLDGFTKLNYLSLSSNDISDINGIEKAALIKRLSFNSNKIQDITLLSNLQKLEHLDLTYNKVTNLQPLSNLPKLEYLSLYENGLSDISPLAGIKTLKSLYLNNNNITDVTPLQGFESFENLNVTGNPIDNFQAINHIENVIK